MSNDLKTPLDLSLLQQAADKAGVGDQVVVEIDDKLTVTLSASERNFDRLKEQLVGMPLSISYQIPRT